MSDSELICRLCMSSKYLLRSVFENDIHSKIEECVNLLLTNDDLLPLNICTLCSLKVKDFYEFKQNCVKVQELLIRWIEEKECQNFDNVEELKDDLEMDNDETSGEICAYTKIEASEGDVEEAVDVDAYCENFDSSIKDEIIIAPQSDGVDSSSDLDEESIKIEQGTTFMDDIDEKRYFKSNRQTKKESRKRLRKERDEKEIYKSLLFPCDVCGKMIERNRMEGHKNQHTGMRPFTCDDSSCDASFHCKIALRLHVRNKHSDESHTCDVCEKVYSSKKALYHHKKETHSEKQFSCLICGYAFVSNARLNRHKVTHTGERNFECTHCSKAFYRSNNLKIHLRTHTKERPFSCEFCKKTFGYNRLLKDHTEKYHANIDASFSTVIDEN